MQGTSNDLQMDVRPPSAFSRTSSSDKNQTRPPSALRSETSSRGGMRTKSSDGRPFRVTFPEGLEVTEEPSGQEPPREEPPSEAPPTQGPPTPSQKESNRLAKTLLGAFNFGVDDFVRSQDARLGVLHEYRSKRPTSRGSEPSGSSASSRAATPGSNRSKQVIDETGHATLTPPASSAGSRGSRASSAREKRVEKDSAYMKAKQEQAERQAREELKRVEQQARLLKKKQELNNYNAQLLQAWVRSGIWRAGRFSDQRKLYIFHHRAPAMFIVNRCYSVAVRRAYERNPYVSPDFQHFFPGLSQSTLLANWECKKSSEWIAKRNFKEAHECLKRAFADLQEMGFLLSSTEDDLPTAYFAKADVQRAHNKGENPFCAVPGCSRRPVKLCEWDGYSKICDQHQHPAKWDKDSKSLVYTERHSMNIAAPNRRDFFWVNFLAGMHKRLGGDSYIKDLVLPKIGHHGAEKYDNNRLHFLQVILTDAWTITVPDEYETLPAAVAACKDDMVIKIRSGFFSWREPIEVRKRIHVRGEDGCVLHGSWVMDEGSGGGTFENIVAVSNGGCIFHMRGGEWKFSSCTLRGFGDGCCVVSSSGSAQVSVKESIISGVETDYGTFLPYGSVTCAGNSTFEAEGSCFVGSTGFAVQATDKVVVKMVDVLLEGHCRAAIRLDKDADVMAKDCRIVGNTAVVAASGQNVPVQVRNYDPKREEFYKTESDCLQLMGCTISGPVWASSRRPVHILGRCQSKMSIDRGDITKDNIYLPANAHTPPPAPKSGTGNEPFTLQIPDSSALKVTTGYDLIEPYVRQRMLVEEEVKVLRARAASRSSSRRGRTAGGATLSLAGVDGFARNRSDGSRSSTGFSAHVELPQDGPFRAGSSGSAGGMMGGEDEDVFQ